MGNFIIDSMVIIVCFYILKIERPNLKGFYKASILKVCIFGFIADIIGASLLLGIQAFRLPGKIVSAINFDPFRRPAAVAIIVIAMLVSSVFIFLLNYFFTFKRVILEKGQRIKWRYVLQ